MMRKRVARLGRGRRAVLRAQVALEYVLLVVVLVLPLAAAIREYLSDSNEESPDNIIREATSNSYGDRERFGTIGRPYP
jgi:hypothetical protein